MKTRFYAKISMETFQFLTWRQISGKLNFCNISPAEKRRSEEWEELAQSILRGKLSNILGRERTVHGRMNYKDTEPYMSAFL
jgi:hypothetical protein